MGWLKKLFGGDEPEPEIEVDVSTTGRGGARMTLSMPGAPAEEVLAAPPPTLTDSLTPPPLPRLSRPPHIPLAERPYATTVCPYCGVEPKKLPKSKSKCKSCGQPIYVQSGADGMRHLLREDDQGAFGARYDALHDQWDREEREALQAAGFLYGEWDIDVVGESHHQPALTRLASRAREYAALLIREPDNPHDDHAVRVDIDGQPVGHLSRESALDAQLFLEHLQRQGRPAWIRATIRGGGSRKYGVFLDGLPDDEEWQDR